jgi:CheY-like chemotaxis protein
MHILFVDDTFETRDLFRLCFSLSGHTADTAHNGLEALQIIQQTADSLDVIIMDYHMPQMTGLEVVQRLRESPALSHIPIILFTSDRTEVLQGEAKDLGIARVVHKPTLPHDLIAVVQEVVDNARLEREKS